jgi:IS5 family transposase
MALLPIAPKEVRVHTDVKVTLLGDIRMERELWKIVSSTITAVDRGFAKGRYAHSVGRIVRVYLWATLNDRPVYWACRKENWRGVHQPSSLPDQSRMSRRLRQEDTQRFLAELLARLSDTQGPHLLKIIDGMPLTVSRHSQDADATFGYGAGGMSRGYKYHAIYGRGRMPLAWAVHPLNVDERCAAIELLGQLPDEGYLLGDRNYDANGLHDHAKQHGQQLVAARRYGTGRGLGHHRHSLHRIRSIDLLEGPSDFGRSLYERRRDIETRFGNLRSFGGGLTHLPHKVRQRADRTQGSTQGIPRFCSAFGFFK